MMATRIILDDSDKVGLVESGHQMEINGTQEVIGPEVKL
jgi:hypothetical protein